MAKAIVFLVNVLDINHLELVKGNKKFSLDCWFIFVGPILLLLIKIPS